MVTAERKEALRPMSSHIDPPTGMILNPHHAAAEQRNLEWVLRFNPSLAQEPAKLDRLRQTRFSRLAAFTYPCVGLDELTLLCDWITWLFVHDDCWCDDSDVDEHTLTVLHTRVLATLRGELAPEPGDDSLLHMCAELASEDRPEVGLSVVVLKTADNKAKILRVLAPLGVLLPNGLGLNVDGKDMGRAYFVRCFQDGCYAEVILEDALIKTLQGGTSATFIVFQTPEEGIGIPVDLKGFADGYAALP